MEDNLKLKEKAKALSERFAEVRDELRVKSHLMGMEFKDAGEELQDLVGKIQGRLQGFYEEAKTTSGELRVQGHLGLLEAKEQLESLSEDLERVYRASKDQVKADVDYAGLKGRLAAMDTRDFLEKQRVEWEKQLRESGDAGKELAHQSMDTINKILDRIRN